MNMLINGQFRNSSTEETVAVYNPANGQLIDTVPVASLEDVELALRTSVVGKGKMKRLSSYQRYEILRNISVLLKQNTEELAKLLTQENGKPIKQTTAEVECAAYIFESFAEEAKRITGTVIPIGAQPGN